MKSFYCVVVVTGNESDRKKEISETFDDYKKAFDFSLSKIPNESGGAEKLMCLRNLTTMGRFKTHKNYVEILSSDNFPDYFNLNGSFDSFLKTTFSVDGSKF